MNSLNIKETLTLVFVSYIAITVARSVCKMLYTYVIGPAIYKVDFKSKGRWALVTGCTDGIGKEYAKQLAAKGCDIILVSRSSDKLKVTAEEIEKLYKVNTKIIKADFDEGDQIYENMSKEIENLEIGTLVNNVGTIYSYPEYFLNVPDWENKMNSLIKVNILSMVRMNKLVLPGMIKRRRGVVINIGSASAVLPCPLLSVYGATKAFVDKLSQSLQMEYSKDGIIVQTVNPSYVISNMTPHLDRSSLFAPSSERFVRSALSTVNVVSRTTGYLPHDISVGIVDCMRTVSDTVTTRLMIRWMEWARDRVLRKYKDK